MTEIWKDVVDFEEYFQISSFGRVFSKRTNKVLKQTKHQSGYLTISTKIGGRQGISKCFKIHRLVAEAFLINDENKDTVNHKDGIKTNNNIENLEWATYSENVQHSYENGLQEPIRGCRNSQATLSEADVRLIRSSDKTERELAEIFNVSKTTISKCKNCTRYAGVAQ